MSNPLQQQNFTQNQKPIVSEEFRRSLKVKLSLSPVLSQKTPISNSKVSTSETQSTNSSKKHLDSSHNAQLSNIQGLSQSPEGPSTINLEKTSPLIQDVPHKKRRVI
jgi:hypothetical protein